MRLALAAVIGMLALSSFPAAVAGPDEVDFSAPSMELFVLPINRTDIRGFDDSGGLKRMTFTIRADSIGEVIDDFNFPVPVVTQYFGYCMC